MIQNNSNETIETRDLINRVASRLKEAREIICLDIAEVADEVGISLREIAKLENGEREVTWSELSDFSKIYQRPLDWFLKEYNIDASTRTDIKNSLSKSVISWNLINAVVNQQNWDCQKLENPVTLYQASLRLGLDYKSTVNVFEEKNFITKRQSKKLLNEKLLDTKRRMLENASISKLNNRNVWCLTSADNNLRIKAKSQDIIIFKLNQHAAAGYFWDIEELEKAGFNIICDFAENHNPLQVGGAINRVTVTELKDVSDGEYEIQESRSWESDSCINKFSFILENKKNRADLCNRI